MDVHEEPRLPVHGGMCAYHSVHVAESGDPGAGPGPQQGLDGAGWAVLQRLLHGGQSERAGGGRPGQPQQERTQCHPGGRRVFCRSCWYRACGLRKSRTGHYTVHTILNSDDDDDD